MREIKFRAWDKSEKQMLYRGVFDRNWYATPENDAIGCHCVDGIHPDDRYNLELMQFTGLTDKNGKDIYEGDIIESLDSAGETIKHTIEYDEEIASFTSVYVYNVNLTQRSGINQKWINEFEKEVIGNIHENKDLLK